MTCPNIEVWHFSSVSNLKTLVPHTPLHPEYNDFCVVYLATSIYWCKAWADAMTKEGDRKPPFYIYKGFVSINDLFCIESNNEKQYFLTPVSTEEIQSIDQVLSKSPVNVELIEVYNAS